MFRTIRKLSNKQIINSFSIEKLNCLVSIKYIDDLEIHYKSSYYNKKEIDELEEKCIKSLEKHPEFIPKINNIPLRFCKLYDIRNTLYNKLK